MTLSTQGIAAVIPVFNEAENVTKLAEELQEILSSHSDFEIIFVDDASTDNTVATLEEVAQRISQVKIVKHKTNYGQSASIVSGVRAASMEWIVTLDGDGQNNPADIPKLAAGINQIITNKPKVVAMGNREKRNDTWVRRVSSRVANKIRVFLLNDDCPDTGCSLKLFTRQAFLELPHFKHCHRYLPALFKRAGYEVVNVKVSHRPRLYGESKYGIGRIWPGVFDLIGMLWLNRRPCTPEIVVQNND